ncbi:MAG: hypothetical protein NTZ37_06270 [Methanoregula sp.]|nr:hypothetical protein [Methanoregula sp.]
MTPATIAISPPAMNAIFNNTTVKAINTAHATNTNPRIITPKPSQTFMNQGLGLIRAEEKGRATRYVTA